MLEVPAVGEGFQLDQGRFTIPSGAEGVYCMRLPVPPAYGEGPLYVRGVRSILPVRTHHFFMAYNPTPVAGPTPCNGEEGLVISRTGAGATTGNHAEIDGKMVFLAAVGEHESFMPPGYALYLQSGVGHFTTSHHVLNLTPEDGAMYGVFNIYTAPAAEVTHPMNIFNCLLDDIDVPARSEGRVSATCTAPFDLDLVILGSHAHQFLTSFQMRFFDGERTGEEILYENTDWDSPKIETAAQPIHLARGQGITFSCDYYNPTSEPLSFGAGETQEMCAVMSAYAYPTDRPNEVPPPLGTIIMRNEGIARLYDSSGVPGPF